MDDFFRNVPVGDAVDIEEAAKVIFELRESRRSILSGQGVDDEADLLERIRQGSVPEHPAYEAYLSARIVGETREALRRDLEVYLAQANGSPAKAVNTAEDFSFAPAAMQSQLEETLAGRIDGELLATWDALIFKLINGVTVELRILSASEYVFGWLWGDAILRIDTAPVPGRQVSTASHFHDLEGAVLPDPVTIPGRPALENITRLIEALLADPLLVSPHREG